MGFIDGWSPETVREIIFILMRMSVSLVFGRWGIRLWGELLGEEKIVVLNARNSKF